MYRILLADDEGIVLDSVRMIIEKNFGNTCQIEVVKTGRAFIEKAEEFRPDIAMVDIQMPGINGIDAMGEVKKFLSSVHFIVMSAYDKFDYAQKAIDLGVVEYITKPVSQKKICNVLEKAMALVEQERFAREKDLRNKEKLEIVVPIIESGMIYNILMEDNYSGDVEYYRNLLDIQEENGMVMVVEFGDSIEDSKMTNVVGVSVKAQKFYQEFREIAKEFFPAVVGPIMANKIVLLVPWEETEIEYNARLVIIERARNMTRKLNRRIDVKFRTGIGTVWKISKLSRSYKEACIALKNTIGSVAHFKDYTPNHEAQKDYPFEIESRIFEAVKKGNSGVTKKEANSFFDWMEQESADHIMDIRLKVLEIVMYAERIVFYDGAGSYYFSDRRDYMPQVLEMTDLDVLRQWFVSKLLDACDIVANQEETQYSAVVAKARQYIAMNFHKDISLDEVSRMVNVSPYYFSKIFKEETGENFIEFLTKMRIEHAKKLLHNEEVSIKEVCIETGYSDPNYFSRIFKKNVGVTPTEYRDGGAVKGR